MIDLTGITQLADVTIAIGSTSEQIKFTFANDRLKDAHLPELTELKNSGCQVFGSSSLGIFVSPGVFDSRQLAERIAAHFENKGLKVLRLVTDPSAFDKTPKMPIQSFILA